MAKKSIVWVILPECPDSFLEKLSKIGDDEEAFVDTLIEGHNAGHIRILGSTDKDAKDIAAVLQEHFTVKVVKDERTRKHGPGAR